MYPLITASVRHSDGSVRNKKRGDSKNSLSCSDGCTAGIHHCLPGGSNWGQAYSLFLKGEKRSNQENNDDTEDKNTDEYIESTMVSTLIMVMDMRSIISVATNISEKNFPDFP